MNRLISAAILSTLIASVSAQDTFEVVSVRPVDLQKVPGVLQTALPCSGAIEQTAGRITIAAATVHRLITLAYGFPCGAATTLEHISGGPDWLRKQGFSVQATLPSGTPLYTFQQ